MPKNYGPRSKFSLLPHQVRWRIYNLMLDGATLKSLLADPEIDAALAKAGTTLSRANLAGIRKSREYADFAAMRRKHLEAKQKDMMLTAIAQGTGTLESMTDQARVRLMETLSDLSDLSDLPDEERIKAVRSLSQSVASLSNPVKDSQITELKRKLADLVKEKEALLAEIANLKTATDQDPAGRGISEDALRQAEEKIKLL